MIKLKNIVTGVTVLANGKQAEILLERGFKKVIDADDAAPATSGIESHVASSDGDGASSAEPGEDDEDVPTEKSKKDEIDAFAKARNIDLGNARSNKDKLKIINKALAEAGE